MIYKGKFTIKAFIHYMDTWKELDREQDNIRRIPFYYFFKFHSILNKKHRLTKEYGEWIDKPETWKNLKLKKQK